MTIRCTFGDPAGTHTIVLYGDSHAGMWFQTLNGIAIRQHWKLIILFKNACPASLVSVAYYGRPEDFTACDEWHRYVTGRIKAINPEVLILSQTDAYFTPAGDGYTTQQWQRSVEGTLTTLSTPKTRKTVVIGNLAETINGPTCLARHKNNVQACSTPPNPAYRV